MVGSSRVHVGEPAPWFAAPIGPGQPNSVLLDELAGRSVVLFFYGSAAHSNVANVLASLAERHSTFEYPQPLLVAISNNPDDFGPAQVGQAHSAQLRLFDLKGDIARLYCNNLIEPIAFVLSPALQVVEMIKLAEPAQFIEQISFQLQALNAIPAGNNAPVLIVPRVFDDAICKRLTDLYDLNGGRESGSIEYRGKQLQQFDPDYRKRRDWYISDQETLREIRELLERRLLPIIYRAFQFQVTRIERYLIGCYDAKEGGHFRPHRDNTAPVVAHRRFALSINLNNEYDGGNLRFPEFGYQCIRAAQGDAIVFSCSLLHEVTPIIANRRYAFLSFLYDEASERLREQNKTAWVKAQSAGQQAATLQKQEQQSA